MNYDKLLLRPSDAALVLIWRSVITSRILQNMPVLRIWLFLLYDRWQGTLRTIISFYLRYSNMSHEEYLSARQSTEWQIEDLQQALEALDSTSTKYVLYATTIATLQKELSELDARFMAH